MKKKIMLLLMSTVLISSMIGCGNKATSNTVTAHNQETNVDQLKEQIRKELEEEQKNAVQAEKKAEEEKKALEDKIRKEIQEEEANKNKVDQEELKKQIKQELEAEQKSSQSQVQSNSTPSVVIVKETIPQSVYYSNSYIFPQSSNSYLSKSQVRSLSNYELGIARNEIYARHGYIFQLQTFRSYFQSQNWYVPRTTNQSSISLNSVEQSNVALIKAEEDRRGITW